jgi:hypothetical protein
MPAVIKALWGCAGPVHRWKKVWDKDVRKQMSRDCSCPQYIYVYGKENANLLCQIKKSNVQVILVDPNPFPDGKPDRLDDAVIGGIYRPWQNKYTLIGKAIEDHGEIVYSDFDVNCHAKSTEEVFSHLQNRTISLSAFMYHQVRLPYRINRWAKRWVASGNWLHIKGPDWPKKILHEMETQDPVWAWHDEFVISRMIDRDYDVWVGEEEWLKKYESPIMVQGDSRSPWARIPDLCTSQKIVRQTTIPFQWIPLFTR